MGGPRRWAVDASKYQRMRPIPRGITGQMGVPMLEENRPGGCSHAGEEQARLEPMLDQVRPEGQAHLEY